MLPLFQGILLGTVQGLTEFLPVSSSGHLILARELLHLQTPEGLAVDAILQLGTLLAVIAYFRFDLIELMQTTRDMIRGKAIHTPRRTLLIALILGSIPAAILGLLFESTLDTAFRSPLLVAASLSAGSLLFLIAEFVSRKYRSNSPLTITGGFWVGCFQALALIPGMSRSGSTISGGLLMGFSRSDAARFSFLLSIPIIGASGVYKFLKLIAHGSIGTEITLLIPGFLCAAIVGYFSIRWLLQIVSRFGLLPFVAYRLLLSGVVLWMIHSA